MSSSLFVRTSMTPAAASQVALAIMRRHYRRWHFNEDLLRRVCLCGSVYLVSNEASMAEISEAEGGVLVEWRCRIGFAVRDALFAALPAALA